MMQDVLKELYETASGAGRLLILPGGLLHRLADPLAVRRPADQQDRVEVVALHVGLCQRTVAATDRLELPLGPPVC